MTPSKYQQAIFDEYNKTSNNIAIQAVPGSGKTTTLLELLKRTLEYKSSIFLAFNKSIADELKSKVPSHSSASTLHSIGFKTLIKYTHKQYKVSAIKNWILGKKILNIKAKNPKQESLTLFTISALVDLYRMNMCTCLADLEKVSIKYNITVHNGELKQAMQLMEYLDKYNSQDHGNQQMMIDFVDMIYLPLKMIPEDQFPKYNVVLVDECLPYHMPILLSDGSSLPIGKIVEENIDCEVLTFNTQTGEQEFKKVINRSRSINDKKLLKIDCRGIRDGHLRSYVVCTYNHKVYTKNKGFIYAEEIENGDIVQFETSAKKTQKYKITKSGSDNLSLIMNSKNSDPIYRSNCKGNPSKEKFNSIKGGNGSINELQEEFLKALIKETGDENWVSELVIPTKAKRSDHMYPTCYKADIGNENLKILIELDGGSHNNLKQKEKDKKKDDFLKSKGYFVKRIKNKDLIRNFSAIIDHIKNNDFSFCYDGVDCPIDMKVIDVSEVNSNERWVYDLTVEGNHNFYANGILVHNCQDLSSFQYAFVSKLLTKRSRLISCGDSKQAIYSFMGADSDVFDMIKSRPNTTVLPLSFSYRCPKKIVERANQVFPVIESPEWQIEGEIIEDGSINDAQPGDFVLCRNNKPLIETFLYLLKQKIPCKIMGKEYGSELLKVLLKIEDFSTESKNKIIEEKATFLKEKGIHNYQTHNSYVSLIEKINILDELHSAFESIYDMTQVIESMFSDEQNTEYVILSTIHRSKGLEADNIFYLFKNLIPSQYAKTQLELMQEKCLEYVCITRAKKKLTYLNKIG